MHSIFRRLDLNLLLIFDALYRHRSVTAAAGELSLSASAFSHALGRLRESLGDELFVRQGNRMHPTQRAERLAGTVAASLLTLSEGLGQWQPFEPLTSERTFTFAATDYTALQLLPGLIAHLERVAPRLRLKVVYSERKVCIEELASGQVDFALGYGEKRDNLPTGIDCEDWQQGEYVVIARHGHPALGNGLDLPTFLDQRHLVVTPWGESSGVVDLVLQGMGLQRKVALQIPSVLLGPFIVADSDLLMTIARSAFQALAPAADVVEYRPPFAIDPYVLRLYSHRKYARSDAHAWMAGQLRALFGAQA